MLPTFLSDSRSVAELSNGSLVCGRREILFARCNLLEGHVGYDGPSKPIDHIPLSMKPILSDLYRRSALTLERSATDIRFMQAISGTQVVSFQCGLTETLFY